jgi:hypothetical protein
MAARKSEANGAPPGYRKVETRIGGFWKPKKKGDFIEGVVGHRVSTQGIDGKENSYYTFRLADDQCTSLESSDGKHLAADGGALVGIGGKTLLTFLEEHEGRAVYIVYKGLGIAKKGQNAPKLYDTFEREGETS